ncbi:hypothetical protein AB6A40_004123 [Gnathostoma spinigerum]|uniref:Protein kinase domain-containing protein n=1 Tax=Gnathostoma spinigerum TaxID=75299 RepID=A0ABD6EBI8_9BILA
MSSNEGSQEVVNRSSMLSSGGPSVISSSGSCIFDFPDIPASLASSDRTRRNRPTTSTLTIQPVTHWEVNPEEPSTTSSHSSISRVLPSIISSVSGSPVDDRNHISRTHSDSRLLSTGNVGTYFGPSSIRLSHSSVSPNARAIKLDYLYKAAQFISMAQKAELEKVYELAFNCYKGAVDALILGAQSEEDISKRNVARRKAAKYMNKAEQIYRQYLSFDGTNFLFDSWSSESFFDPNMIAFQGSPSSLRGYAVIKVLPSLEARNRVILVEEKYTGVRYVVKLLEKTSYPSKALYTSCTILPIQIPHMVHLVKFFDTENNIILMLEHIEGGRLWDFLSDYFDECTERIQVFKDLDETDGAISDLPLQEERENEQNGDVYLKELSSDTGRAVADITGSETQAGPSTAYECGKPLAGTNKYEGRHVRFSICSEGDEPRDLTDNSPTEGTGKKYQKYSFESTVLDSSVMRASDDEATAANNRVSLSCANSQNVADNICNTVDVVLSDQTPELSSISVDEEAPAPINLSSKSAGSSWSHSPLSDEKSLSQAISNVKQYLHDGKRWPRDRNLQESLILHWMAQLVSAVYCLHQQGVIIRDLNPENILIDLEGNLKLTYCGQWNNVEKEDDSNAIKNGYCAPEVSMVSQSVTDAADRWSIGCILYELLTGQTVKSACPYGMTTIIELPIPECVSLSLAARDILNKLLLHNAMERLSDEDLRSHPFFADCDWEKYDRMLHLECGYT